MARRTVDMDAAVADLARARDDVVDAIRSGDPSVLPAAERNCEASLDYIEGLADDGVEDLRLAPLLEEFTALLLSLQQLH